MIAVSWLMPSVCAPGTVITGVTLAVTATVAGVAALPKLSLAVSVIVSGPAELSVSFSVPRSAFTWLSVPLMTRSVELLPDVAPLADSNPLLSFSVTVKVSLPVVLPVSARLTPAIAVAVPSATVCAPGTAITGAPFTVTAIVAAVALLPKLSLALTVIVSGPAVPSVSFSVPRSLFKVVSDSPLKVSV